MAATEFARELIQNRERFTCPGCGSAVMRSRHLYRYTAGPYVVTLCTSCPAPIETPEPVPTASSESRPAVRRNRYPSTCECGRHVPAGAGYLENDGGWIVFCGSCGLSATVG